MEGWKRSLALLLFPLTLCGLMLLFTSTATQVAVELRRPLRLSGLLLGTPGVVLMLLSIPLRNEDTDPDDGEGPEDPASPKARWDA